MQTIRKIFGFISRFGKDTRGVVTVEAVIILPLLFWALAAVAIFFDGFRTRSQAEKAAFTVADMLSRETNAISANYITNTRTLFDSLANSNAPSSMRISTIRWNSSNAQYEVVRSRERGSHFAELRQSDVSWLGERLPTMAAGDFLILVETSNQFNPILNVGLGDIEIDTFVFTRPRGPQLVIE